MNKMRISTFHMLILVVLMTGISSAAYALKIEGFKLSQRLDANKMPEVRVNFDRTADTWNQVTGDDVVVKVNYELDVKSAYALQPGSKITVTLDNMGGQDQLQSMNNNYGELHLGLITLSRSGNATDEIKAAALATCKLIRQNGGKPSKEHRIKKRFQLSGVAYATHVGPLYNEESATRDIGIDIVLVCNEDPGWREPSLPPSIANDVGPFKPNKIEVFLTTFQNQVSHPTPGMTSCKKLYVKVRIEANTVGVASYKLWRTPGEERIGMPMTKLQKTGPFKGRFIAEDVYVDTFDSTTYVQYMAEMGGTFGLSTPWKDIHIVCSSGGGGLSGAHPGDGPDPVPPGQLKAPSTIPPPPPAPPGQLKAPSMIPPPPPTPPGQLKAPSMIPPPPPAPPGQLKAPSMIPPPPPAPPVKKTTLRERT